jgi:hypothetical protein
LKQFALALSLMFAACTGGSKADPPRAAADPAPDADGGPAGEAGSSAVATQPEFHFSLIALFLEVERGARAECPCWLQSGKIESLQACTDMMTLQPGWQACIDQLPLPENSEQLNEQLHCSLRQLQRVNDCVDAAECEAKALGACRQTTLDCQTASQSFLTGVVNACPGSGTARH